MEMTRNLLQKRDLCQSHLCRDVGHHFLSSLPLLNGEKKVLQTKCYRSVQVQNVAKLKAKSKSPFLDYTPKRFAIGSHKTWADKWESFSHSRGSILIVVHYFSRSRSFPRWIYRTSNLVAPGPKKGRLPSLLGCWTISRIVANGAQFFKH